MTKPTQNTHDPRMTTTRTNSEAANASCTSECQSKNHRVPKADPTAAPTMTWFSVWRRWDTRNHDCTQIRLELACSQWHKTTAWCYENGNIHDMIEHGGASKDHFTRQNRGAETWYKSWALFLPDRRPLTELQAQESRLDNLSHSSSTLHFKRK